MGHVLTILRSAGRTSRIVATAIMCVALFIYCSAVGTYYVCRRIGILRNGACVSLMSLTPLSSATRTCDITAAGTVVLLVLAIIFLTMTAFGKATAASMVSLMLAIFRAAMITGHIHTAAIMRISLFVKFTAMIASYECIRNRAWMLFVLAILRSTVRTGRIYTAAIMCVALLIRCPTVDAGYICFRIGIRSNGTIMSLMCLTP